MTDTLIPTDTLKGKITGDRRDVPRLVECLNNINSICLTATETGCTISGQFLQRLIQSSTGMDSDTLRKWEPRSFCYSCEDHEVENGVCVCCKFVDGSQHEGV